jgi:hypothetical protein
MPMQGSAGREKYDHHDEALRVRSYNDGARKVQT